MEKTITPLDVLAIGSTLLGILIAYIVMAVVTDTRVPFITSDRSAFVWVFVLGFTMCAVGGIGRTQATLGWLHPITIIGSVLGMLALVLSIAVFTGRTGFLSSATTIFGSIAVVASGERIALILLAAIIFAKWALGFGKYVLR